MCTIFKCPIQYNVTKNKTILGIIVLIKKEFKILIKYAIAL